jgi:hypothetical protein
MKLAPLGKQLVAPEAEGEDLAARREAIMKPRLLNEFFAKYRRAKLPNDVIAGNVLKAMGLPPDRTDAALEIVKENGRYAGIIREMPTGPFINLDSPGVPAPTATPEFPEQSTLEMEPASQVTESMAAANTTSAVALNQPSTASLTAKANRLFITHGKQRGIVVQMKELLTFGSFEPVVSVEREATAIPLPEKVFEDMRSCAAGVIHVGAEGKYLDKDGNEATKLNDNVLIEIGAAMALYGKRSFCSLRRVSHCHRICRDFIGANSKVISWTMIRQ